MTITIPSCVDVATNLSLSDAMTVVNNLNKVDEYSSIYQFGVRATDAGSGQALYNVTAVVIKMRDLLVKKPNLQYQDVL